MSERGRAELEMRADERNSRAALHHDLGRLASLLHNALVEMKEAVAQLGGGRAGLFSEDGWSDRVAVLQSEVYDLARRHGGEDPDADR